MKQLVVYIHKMTLRELPECETVDLFTSSQQPETRNIFTFIPKET